MRPPVRPRELWFEFVPRAFPSIRFPLNSVRFLSSGRAAVDWLAGGSVDAISDLEPRDAAAIKGEKGVDRGNEGK